MLVGPETSFTNVQFGQADMGCVGGWLGEEREKERETDRESERERRETETIGRDINIVKKPTHISATSSGHRTRRKLFLAISFHP